MTRPRPSCGSKWEDEAQRTCSSLLTTLGFAVASVFTLGASIQLILTLTGTGTGTHAFVPATWCTYAMAGSGLWAVVTSDFFRSLTGAQSADSWQYRLVWATGSLCASLVGVFVLAARSDALLLEMGMAPCAADAPADACCRFRGLAMALVAAFEGAMVVCELVLLGLCVRGVWCRRRLGQGEGGERSDRRERQRRGNGRGGAGCEGDGGDEKESHGFLDPEFFSRIAS